MNTNQEPIDVTPEPEQTTALAVRQEAPAPAVSAPPQAKTAHQYRTDDIGQLLAGAYAKASTLELTQGEIDKLTAPFPDSDIEIRPHDGLIYIPHITISQRLISVFGPGKWAMIRRSERIESNRIYAEWVMVIRGCFIGESVGAMDYHPNNPKMNYSDALEGTRGECIRRIAGKDLGCGAQVWNPAYARDWVAKYADKGRDGKWYRKTNAQAPTRPVERPAASEGPQIPPASQKPPISQPSAKAPTTGKKASAYEEWLNGCLQTLFRELEGAPEQAQAYFEQQDWVMPGEPYVNASVGRIFPDCAPDKDSAANTAAMQKSYNEVASAVLGNHPQASEPEPDIPGTDVFVEGELQHVSEKEGQGKKGPWKLYGVKVNDTWANTFDKKLGKLAKEMKGTRVRMYFEEGERGNNLCAIRRI